MSHHGFAASIRWRLLEDPRWEAESVHWGFESAEDAALFANGFGARAAKQLLLHRAGMDWWLRRIEGDGTVVDDVEVWLCTLMADEVGGQVPVVWDHQFEQVSARRLVDSIGPAEELIFAPLHYGIRDPDGRAVDVELSLDESWFLRATVDGEGDGGESSVVLLSS